MKMEIFKEYIGTNLDIDFKALKNDDVDYLNDIMDNVEEFEPAQGKRGGVAKVYITDRELEDGTNFYVYLMVTINEKGRVGALDVLAMVEGDGEPEEVNAKDYLDEDDIGQIEDYLDFNFGL